MRFYDNLIYFQGAGRKKGGKERKKKGRKGRGKQRGRRLIQAPFICFYSSYKVSRLGSTPNKRDKRKRTKMKNRDSISILTILGLPLSHDSGGGEKEERKRGGRRKKRRDRKRSNTLYLLSFLSWQLGTHIHSMCSDSPKGKKKKKKGRGGEKEPEQKGLRLTPHLSLHCQVFTGRKGGEKEKE